MLFENRVYEFYHINEKKADCDKFQLWFYFIKHNKKSLCKMIKKIELITMIKIKEKERKLAFQKTTLYKKKFKMYYCFLLILDVENVFPLTPFF